VIPAGVWQAGELVAGGDWALYGCTMAPGFTPSCFEGGTVELLLATHPRRAADIERLGV
jgi:predicted cupin superfamily sugar epimerase